ncbi:cRISPR-associated endoribonuclease Cas2 2 [Firmicutes bacterium CAG:882]|nr:cRISPR-associated endoribonuclease Cas2 2 [Firmicutes bacterium CAG:882]
MENYFWNMQEIHPVKKMYILIIYDIVNNKRRYRFAKKMKGYGFRVQRSAFEAFVSDRLYLKLMKEVPKIIDSESDSVRIYRIGYEEVQLFGKNIKIQDRDVIIV